MAQWIRPWTLNREVPGSNLLAAAVVPLARVDMPNLLQNFSFSVCATNNPIYLNDISIKFEYLVV